MTRVVRVIATLAVIGAVVLPLSGIVLVNTTLEGRSGVPGSAAQSLDRPVPAPVSRASTTSGAQQDDPFRQVEDFDALLPPCAPLDLSTATAQHPAPLDAPVANCDHRELDLGPAPIKKQAHPMPSGVELTGQP